MSALPEVNIFKKSLPISQLSSLPLEQQKHNKEIFISRAQRFSNTISSNSPGPGSYEGFAKQKHTLDFRVLKEKSESSSEKIKKQYQWIVSESRTPFNLSNIWQNTIGPGSYDNKIKSLGNSASRFHSSWNKCTRFQYQKSKSKQNNQIGPGYYECLSHFQKQNNTLPLSVFKSKSPKSFLDELLHKEKKALSQQKLENSKSIIQEEENPEINEIQNNERLDDAEISQKRLHSKPSSIFASKSKRPQLINQNSLKNVGPGTYNLHQFQETKQAGAGQNQKKNIISAIHPNALSHKKLLQQRQRRSESTSPGPGYYKNQIGQIQSESKHKKGIIGYISKESRFREEVSKETQNPGPGQYMRKKYMLIDEEAYRLKQKISFTKKYEKEGTFLSKAGRSNIISSNDVPFGKYNLNQFDMDYKLNKQKQHWKKLKMMEVQMAGFNSKMKR